MNEKVIETLKLVQQSDKLSEEEKKVIIRSLKDADKELAISIFKIERLEKVKHTTTVLLEQTIEELDAKRKSVEKQKRSLEIEAALERVRSIAMGMREPADMLDICHTIATQLKELGIDEIRNVQTAIFNEDKGTYINYEFYVKHEKELVTETEFRNHPVARSFAEQMMKGANEFFTHSFNGAQVKDWVEYQKGTNVFIDSFLETATSLNYYWYSMGPVALGLSTYAPLSEELIALFNRFRNVFELSYRRYLDIEKAEAQARESQIQLALERVRARTMAMQKSEELKSAAALLFQQVKELGVPAYSCGYNIWEKEEKEFTSWMSTQDGSEINAVYNIPLTEDANFIRYVESKKIGEPFFVLELRGERMQEHYEYLKTIPAFKAYFEYATSVGFIPPETQIHHIANFSKGNLLFITLEPCPEYHDVFKRFAAVFEQTYTRFLDLQKAEAQAREAKVETALERVRSRSMAMQKSNELKELIRLVNEQLVQLDVFVQHAGFIIDYKGRDDMNIWLADPHEVPFQVTLPYFDCAHWNSFVDAKKTGKDFFTNLLSFEEKNKFYEDLFQLIPGAPEEAKAYYLSCAGLAISTVLLDSVGLYIENFDGIPYTTEENNILMRFGKVFQQTYTRFLDLEKAEAQAREAQIEAGLERVRSRAMGMQSSEELKALIGTVFSELTKLDLVLTRCVIWVFDSTTNAANWWMANSEDPFNPMSIFVKYHEHPAYLTFLKEWRSQSLRVVYDLNGQDKIEWDRILFNETELRNLPDAIKDGMRAPDRVLLTASFNNSGALNVASLEPLSDEHFDILLRFAKVFDLTYTRFLDLQKAESQAREAKIQLALERVRARTMAMQHSDELADAAYILFQQFKELGEDPIQITIGIFNEEQNKIEFSITGGNGSGTKIEETFVATIDEPTLMNKLFEAWKLDKRSEVICLEGQELSDWIQYRNALNGKYAYETKVPLGERRHVSAGFFSKGLLSISTIHPLSDETLQILERFSSVFDLTYTRFLDLKQAEKQAREAQIESALEKVRSRSLAMHNSNELEQVVTALFERLVDLGLSIDGALIFLFDREKRDIQLWIATKQLPAPVRIDMPHDTEIENNLILRDLWHAVETGEHIFNRSYSGDAKDDYFRYVVKYNESKVPEPVRQIQIETKTWTGCFAAEKNSLVGFDSWSGSITKAEDFQILIRFARVFEQAYIRFLDLRNAEAQGRESQIETALEKVRSRTLAMQRSDELAETAAVLFQQLINLGIEPNRLYIGIAEDDTDDIEFWITDEDGRKVSTMFKGDGSKNVSIKKMVDGWRSGRKSIVIDMEGQELEDYFHYLGEELHVPFKGGLSQKRRLQYIAFFAKGFIGMASPEEQHSEVLELLERFAYVFNLTFTRFNDLKLAEAHALQAQQDLVQIKEARRRAEEALAELKATQAQLIHSEKMASLGELTAGIAHEIQNPLNFVNNFSEVSGELLEEIKSELDKGEVDEAKAIVEDVRQNLQKIAHHGKRADGIVKSMLQHSRKGSGQRDLVDINLLVDEYLRMSYHGFRAKDKSFNAILETHFDPEIKTVSIIGQDIGRVLLNLFNNAFYAVNERKKEEQNGFEPTIQVTTSRLNGAIQIRVKDNGTGIPEKVLEKIYQPFFTTKPTGEGTGLGLSLSYDIITKGHGGDMKVETAEGKGSEFVIQLPNLSSL